MDAVVGIVSHIPVRLGKLGGGSTNPYAYDQMSSTFPSLVGVQSVSIHVSEPLKLVRAHKKQLKKQKPCTKV